MGGGRKVVRDVLGVVAVMAVLGAALFAGRYPFGDAATEVSPEAGCDLGAGPCGARLPEGGRAELTASPRPLPLMAPITFTLTLPEPVSEPPRLEVTGVNMDMGVQRTALEAVAKGRYQGEVVLPVCSNRRMQWQARVSLQGPGGALAIPFGFETRR